VAPGWYWRGVQKLAAGELAASVGHRRLVKRARYYWLLPTNGHLQRRLFGQMLQRIWAPPVPSG
jgi:hypothetical protein